jgi:hypothetical protein
MSRASEGGQREGNRKSKAKGQGECEPLEATVMDGAWARRGPRSLGHCCTGRLQWRLRVIAAGLSRCFGSVFGTIRGRAVNGFVGNP